jgi:hypothetical protein
VGKNVCRAPRKKRTADYLFAVRQHKNAWQTIFLLGVFFLPCAVTNMHGKAPLCRAHGKDRNARQTSIFP